MEIVKNEVLEDFSDFYPKDRRDIKRNLRVEQDEDGLYIYAVVIALDPEENRMLNIPGCYGTPIGTTCYNMVGDNFYVEGRDFTCIGEIPINYKVVMNNVVGWHIDIPIPLSVIRRYLSTESKEEFDRWKSKYSQNAHRIEYLQMLNIY